MSINKDKNVTIQITFPKKNAKQLDTLVEAYNKEGIPATRSKVLLKALQEYIKVLVAVASINKKAKKVEEPQGDKKDA